MVFVGKTLNDEFRTIESIAYLDPNPMGERTILLLHGLGTDATSWGYQMPALVQMGLRPIAIDIPGFGQSKLSKKTWSVRNAARNIHAFCKNLQINHLVVVGLSMGGTIALRMAIDYPELLDRLVLVNTFACLRQNNAQNMGYLLRRFFRGVMVGTQAQAELVAMRIFPGPDQIELRSMLVDQIQHVDVRIYRQAMFSLGLFDVRKQLRNIDIPTLIITGEIDSTVSPVLQKMLTSSIPQAVQVIIPKAGHAVTIDQPEQFNKALLDFVG
jgi:3-oxoadipate enol-lactonase